MPPPSDLSKMTCLKVLALTCRITRFKEADLYIGSLQKSNIDSSNQPR